MARKPAPIDTESPAPPTGVQLRRPTVAELATAWRLGGRTALAQLLRAAGWRSCVCPACHGTYPLKPASARLAAFRQYHAALVAADGFASTVDAPCDLCTGTRRLKVLTAFVRTGDTVVPAR